MGKCAWCKVDTDKQPQFHADEGFQNFCDCGAYNDGGQKSISLNSMKEIYDGALKLVSYILSDVEETLDNYDENLIQSIKEAYDLPQDKPLQYCLATDKIVNLLFLSHTLNSGSTSCNNLKKRLGIDNTVQYWTLDKNKNDVQ